MTTTSHALMANAASAAAARRRASARIEDLEFMAAHGEHFDNAARRVGLTPKSLERWLFRHDRIDLVQALRGTEVAA